MFPKTKFKSVNESKISNLLEELSKKYKKIVIVAGSEQVAGLKKLVKENTEIIAINEKNPDANYAKMKQLAVKGLYEEFKKKLPSTIRELDGRRLMNDVRMGLGLDPVKEQLVLVKDKLREQYFRGEIFNEGDIVESNGEQFTIVKRGSNHLLLKEESGKLVSKWIQDVQPMEDKVMNEGVIQPNGTDKLDVSTSDTGAKKDDKEPKGKTKGFMTFYNYNTKDTVKEEIQIDELSTDLLARYKTASHASAKAADASGNYAKGDKRFKGINKATTKQFDNDLKKHGQYKEELEENHIVHVDDGSKYGEQPHDKDVEHVMSGVNTHGGEFDGHSDKGAFFKFKSHSDAKNFVDHVKRSPHKTVGADLHEETKKKEVCPECGEPKCECDVGTDKTSYNQPFDPFFKEDFTEQEIDEMVNSVTDEDIEDLYEEDEIVLVYDDTGEEIPPLQEESKYDLMEVLSRTERMRGKIRLRKTSAKRGRSTRIALQRFSNPTTINKRARRLAIKLMKKRMLRGRDYSKISVGEKERMEKVMSKRKDVIGRIAQKLVSRVRKVEKSRMSHGKVTKGSMPSVF